MNQRTRRLLIPAGAIAVAVASTIGCASSIELHPSLAETATASKYGTFFVLPGSASTNPAGVRQLDAEIVRMLANKGMVETSPSEAEAVVIVRTATPAEHSREAFYRGWGGWNWRVSDARSLNGTETYKPGALVVDIFDAYTKELVWHGSAHAPGSIEKTVADLFRDFPLATRHERVPVTTPAVPLASSQPVRIVFSPAPAILIRIYGEPRYEDVPGTELQRVANTNGLILRDVSGQHYARVAGRWLESDDVLGAWSNAGTVPAGAHIALREDLRLQRSDLFASDDSSDRVPAVYVSTVPMALIVTDGEPHYGALDGTSLLRLSNANAAVFKEPTDQELYVHLTDGWFRSWTTDGPWQAVADADLPADLSIRVRSGLV